MSAEDKRPATFIADAMLGRLAKSLRILGYDTAYAPDIDDSDLKLAALREGRVLLTRDRELSETKLPIRVVLIESDHVEQQLVQVVEELGLRVGRRLFTRCLICNAELVDVSPEDVRGEVPPYVFKTQSAFARCPSCGRIYWDATHTERARQWLEEVLGSLATGGESADDQG